MYPLKIDSVQKVTKCKCINRKVLKLENVDDLACSTQTEGETGFVGVIPRRGSQAFHPRNLKGKGKGKSKGMGQGRGKGKRNGKGKGMGKCKGKCKARGQSQVQGWGQGRGKRLRTKE
jgi:hypothetical protein